MVRGRLRVAGRDLSLALAYPLTTWYRSGAAALVAAVSFVVLVLSTFPRMSAEMLAADVGYLEDALVLLVGNLHETAGPTGVALVFVYAVLTGVAVVDVVAHVRAAGVRSAAPLSGAAPGLLAAGCASCGAGVLSLLGVAGALAALPMGGTLLRIGGVALLVGALAATGDPRGCELSTR